MNAWDHARMPKTIQIRDLDDTVYSRLSISAAEAGLTVPELLRSEATTIASRPSMTEWLSRTARRPSGITREQVLEAIDETRGRWPGAGR
jgi:hypothetical protein